MLVKKLIKIKGLRWWIIALIFLAAVLNYVDRQTLSALAPTIQKDLDMDDHDYANVVNIFLVAYTIAYLISGKIVDKLGTRTGTMVFVIWWSIANMMTAAAQGMKSMSGYRFLLGLGEAGIWPAASKAVSEWFPARERALAIGFYTMGATIGATCAPYIVIPLATYPYAEHFPWLQNFFGVGTGWRLAFIITGAAGLLWLIPWLLLYRKPRENRFLSEKELALIEEGEVGAPEAVAEPSWTWKQVLCFRPTWLLLFGRLITDPVWYFYQFWFAKYLSAERGVSQENLTITWVIYAAAGVGSVLGGWWSGVLIKKGKTPVQGRLRVMLVCACIVPLSPLIAMATGLNMTLAITVVTVFAALAWLINISSLVVDVVPKHSVGTVFSVVAAGSTIGGIIMNTLVASMVSGPSTKAAGFLDQAVQTVAGFLINAVQGQGYGTWFLIMAFLHPLALLLLYVGRIGRYHETPKTQTL
jgi:ACS family hexuronate transporter-like MFS transporter